MKRIALVLLLVTVTVSAQVIVVSPNGPVRTLEEARDAVRAQRRSGKAGPITITVRAGTYYLPETLVLGPEDSDTIWEAPHGEHPVISGGRVISGWTKESTKLAGPVWSADAQGLNFHQLFVNGTRAIRARTPNQGYLRIDGSRFKDDPMTMHFRGSDIKKEWAGETGVEVILYQNWTASRLPVTSVDEATHTVSFPIAEPKWVNEPDARYIVENAPDALDMQGEWYLDRARNKVLFIPWEGENYTADYADVSKDEVIASSLERLVSIEGKPESGQFVRNVVFRGLTFAHADWTMGPHGNTEGQGEVGAPAAIVAIGATDFKMEKCTVAHSGGYGLILGRGSKRGHVLASEFYDLGAGGILLGETHMAPNDAERNYENVIADNHIHGLGLVYPAGIGVISLQSSRNQIIHNHVHGLNYIAISVGWTWGYAPNQTVGNVVAYNRLHDIGRDVLSDLAGIYTLGVQPGTILRNNLIYDVSAFTYGGWGIYPDEGSSEMLIENNIVYGCKSAGFHQHYGRENIVRNNIFAFNGKAELARTRAEQHLSFTMEHNIAYFDQGQLLSSNWRDDKFLLHDNVYYDRRGKDIRFSGKSFADWQASGQDKGSIIADPLFVNADNFDFRLRPESPALKMGFQQIDMSTVGPRMSAGADTW